MGSVNPVTADAAAINNQIQSGWDQGVAYIFQNESGSITNGWHTYVMGNSALSDLREAINSGQGWFSMGFVDRDFTATYYINFDGWSQTNPPYLELATCLSCSPNPPSNLTAEEIVNGYPKVLLNWQDNSTDESSFRIYRKYGYPDDPRQFEQIGVVSPNLTEYIDTTVIVDSTYSYGVTANNYLYSSLYSNFVTITIDPIPVELTSFSADVNDGSVVLNWMTATETNNRGFEVERKVSSKQKSVSSQWESVGFVEGNGTITSAHSYSYTDRNVTGGKYNYRLKQIDFDGSFKYSNVVEVTVNVPLKYSLEQNYPNPFNPSTQISFSLAQDSKVKLKVFDILGREVAVLINENMTSGNHKTVFNASVLPSGVYIYRIEANGSDGSNFTSVRKMVLTK